VSNNCVLDKEHIATVAVPQPTGVNTRFVSEDSTEIIWEQPSVEGHVSIARYRIFVQEKDSTGSKLDFTTPDSKLSYMLRTPRAMWGKDFLVTIQAINKNHKMSLVSEPAVFKIPLLKTSDAAAAVTGFSHAANVAYNNITLTWTPVYDASEYHLQWDKGLNSTRPTFIDLASTTES